MGVISTILIIGLVFFIIAAILLARNNSPQGDTSINDRLCEPVDGVRPELDIDVRSGDKIIHARAVFTFPLVGAYYRWRDGRLTAKDLGPFVGYIVAEHDNPHDPFAIAVYSERDGARHHLGFLPRGKQELHNIITQMGGECPVVGKLENKAYDPEIYENNDLSWGKDGLWEGQVMLVVADPSHKDPEMPQAK